MERAAPGAAPHDKDTPSMHSRREFLRGGAAVAGAGSALALLPASIRRALAIPASP